METLKSLRKEKIHTRQVTITTYSSGGNGVIVEGELKDDRLTPSYAYSGEKRPPGRIHHMIIRMLVKGPFLSIADIEVEMPQTPREQCLETLHCLEGLRGLHIAPGFTNTVKDLAGGIKGCTHLVSLLLAMAPAVVQGFWTYHSRKPVSGDFDSDQARQYLLNTCWVWREDGPLASHFFADPEPPDR